MSTFSLTLPTDAGTLDVALTAGERIFVLGANGTGKSSLMLRLYQANRGRSKRISAHRQNWFESNAVSLTAQQRLDTGRGIEGSDASLEARWQDGYAPHKAMVAIYDLVQSENVRARRIAAAVDAKSMAAAGTLAKEESPLKVINELLKSSNLPVEITIGEDDHVLARKEGGAPYSVAELSDGERNALLMAINVLTAPPGMLILIDEPERHLHRSIVAPLLSALFSKRSDCAFVVSTHDVDLAASDAEAKVLLLRSCTYDNKTVNAWSGTLVTAGAAIDEDLRRDMLGGRRLLLFTEGLEHSLDKTLYSILFPGVSVIAKASSRDVERAVGGLNGVANTHWVRAFGVVDNDRRSADEIVRLKEEGVFALPVFSVESIYYHPEVQARVAARHASVVGTSAADLVTSAKVAALRALEPHVARLSRRAIEKSLRDLISRQLPGQPEIEKGTPIAIQIDVAGEVAAESAKLQELLAAQDLTTVIARYPVRETSALSEIAIKLGFQSRKQYESSVRKLILDDAPALAFVRSLFGELKALLTA